MRVLIAVVAIWLLVGVPVSAQPAPQGRGRGAAPGRQQQSPDAQKVGKSGLEAFSKVSQKDQDQIRDIARQLRQALLELNQLRKIPANDPSASRAATQITAKKGDILKLSAAIHNLMQGMGIGAAIVREKEALESLERNGLPLQEQQALADAGFSDDEIAELSVTVATNAAHIPDVQAQNDALKKADSRMSAKSVAQIGAGALLIGFDIGSRWIPLLNAVTAQQAVTSVANGVVLVASGFDSSGK